VWLAEPALGKTFLGSLNRFLYSHLVGKYSTWAPPGNILFCGCLTTATLFAGGSCLQFGLANGNKKLTVPRQGLVMELWGSFESTA